MRNYKSLVLIPAVLFAVACGRDTSAKDVDAALDSDLRLAGQANTAAMDSVSLLERDAQLRAANAGTNNTTAAPRRTTTAPRRTSTTTRSTSSGSGTYSAPATQRTTTERNTARDAAIGAAAGAVIGATTSRDKVQGGIIGAVIGGTAGAVIGHNVDKKKRPVP